jgi:hypothetical protein
MVCIEKCLHFKRKCRHHPHPILDILPVYLTRGISIAGGLLFRTSPFLRWEKLRCTQQAKAHNEKKFLQELLSPQIIFIFSRAVRLTKFSK